MSKNVFHTAGSTDGLPPRIAPDRLDSVCTTIFGRPVVPDVRSTHSVWYRPVRSGAADAIRGVHVMTVPTPGGPASGVARSDTSASTVAAAATKGRCSAGRSGGQ